MLEAPYLCSDNPEDAADDDAPLNPESSSAPPVVDEKEDEDDDDEPEVEEGSDTVSLAESDVSVYFESETSFTDLCRSSSVTLSAINRVLERKNMREITHTDYVRRPRALCRTLSARVVRRRSLAMTPLHLSPASSAEWRNASAPHLHERERVARDGEQSVLFVAGGGLKAGWSASRALYRSCRALAMPRCVTSRPLRPKDGDTVLHCVYYNDNINFDLVKCVHEFNNEAYKDKNNVRSIWSTAACYRAPRDAPLSRCPQNGALASKRICEKLHMKMSELLKNLGIDIELVDLCQDEDVEIEMLTALGEGDKEKAKTKTYDGCTPLHHICFNPNATVEMVKKVHEFWEDAAKEKDEDGDTPLHCACSSDRPKRDLLKEVYAFWQDAATWKNQEGKAPLHYICENGEATKELVQCVYDFDKSMAAEKDIEGKTPLHYICENGKATKELVQCVYAFDKTAAAKKDKARQPRSPRSHAHAGCDP